MQRRIGIDDRMNGMGRHRRLRKALQDQLELAGVSRDIADSENAGDICRASRWRHRDVVPIKRQAPARADQTLIITGADIAIVGPSASTAIPAGAQVIDLSGHTIMPGEVGLHEHTYFGGVKRLTQMSTSGPYLYLAYGITTAMTAGSQLPYHELNLKRAVDAGEMAGPKFLTAGPYLNGGHGGSPKRNQN